MKSAPCGGVDFRPSESRERDASRCARACTTKVQ